MNLLCKQQEEMLKCAVQVTQQQYQEANESKGQVRSVCTGGETEQQYKNKPVIICLHDEGGPLRFSSFLHGARSRTLSDGAVRADVATRGSAEKEASSNKQNVVVSPSTRSFYSILHGSDKIDEGITVESNLSNSERESSLSDDVNASSGSASRFASIFSRGRTFSDNNVMSPEEENSVHSELSDDNAVSPSGRCFYSILHGDTNAASSSEVDATSASRATDDVPSSGSEGDEEEYKDADNAEETLDSDSRMSLLFNSVRRRAFSETTDCRCTISAVGPKIVLSRDELTRRRLKEVTSFLREFKVSVLAALGKRLHRNPTVLKANATITLGTSQRS